MRIAIGSDHHGVNLRKRLGEVLAAAGHTVHDVGPEVDGQVDYPDVAAEVAGAVSQGTADRGVLICGSGIGMAIAANKFHGIRAAACHDLRSAEMSRRHNDTNVLCLSADNLTENENKEVVATWMQTEFDGGRHQRRVDKIAQLEQRA